MVRSVKLNSGSSLPILGMGTVALGESQQQVKDALLTAIQVQWVFLFPP
jgi:diketogulonate reductase-like aldo/keto reductase